MKDKFLKEKKEADEMWDRFMERSKYGEVNQQELALLMLKCNKIDQQLINNEMQQYL